ncbi:MAG: lipopolysaccharide biosynthesis protein, partial [Gammaproteobacteria bacterium]|nr:lipopolysaccharide biosynthesis protein [Gammaproteobacteria bacterium]
RWSMRGIGLVSTIILVRLLAPEDFGLVAMSTLFIALIEVFTSFGVDMALIQRADATREDYDTAWTIRLLQVTVVAVAILVCAPLVAEYFSEPRVTSLTMFLSIGVFVAGFENIGVVAFRKELNFSKEYRFMVLKKLSSFFITIGLAVWLRNYWALAWGIVTGKVAAVAISYIMHPYRPRPSLAKFRDLWSFSQWMLLRNIGMYLRKQLDSFMVARLFSTAQLGYYSVAKEIAELPTTDLVWPMARALFPGYAKIANDRARLGRAYLNVLSTITLITVPTGLGLALVAEPLVLLAFGERWMEVIPALSWLALYGGVLTISAGVQSPLMALGMMRRVAMLVWAQLLLAAPVIVYAATIGELKVIAQAQFFISCALLPVFFFALTSTGIVKWLELGRAIWRPIVAGIIMVLCVDALPAAWSTGPVVELLLTVPVGAASFSAAVYGLWRASGQPDGGERLAVELVSRRLGRG